MIFAPYDTTPKAIEVVIRDDLYIEEAEDFAVYLTGTTGGSASISRAAALVTILDDDLVDIDVDSNNDGWIDPDNGPHGTDDPIEMTGPGCIVGVGDANLTPVAINYFFADYGQEGCRLRLEFDGDGTLLSVWDSVEKNNQIVSGHTWNVGRGDFHTVVYVEGLSAGTSVFTLSLLDHLGCGDALDQVMLSVVYVKAALAEENLNPLILLSEYVSGGEVWGQCTYVQTESVRIEVAVPSALNWNDFFLVIHADARLKVWADEERSIPVAPGVAMPLRNPQYADTFYVDAQTEAGEFPVRAELYWVNPFTQQPGKVGQSSQNVVFERIVYDGANFVLRKTAGWARTATAEKVHELLDENLKPALQEAIDNYIEGLGPNDPDYAQKQQNARDVISCVYDPLRQWASDKIGQTVYDAVGMGLNHVLPNKPAGAGPEIHRGVLEGLDKVFRQPGSQIDRDSFGLHIGLKNLRNVVVRPDFQNALRAAGDGNYDPLMDFLKTVPNYVEGIWLTANLRTQDDKEVLFRAGIATFDYVPGEKQWWEVEQLRHNQYFLEYNLRKEDWPFLNRAIRLRLDFTPKDRQTGQFRGEGAAIIRLTY